MQLNLQAATPTPRLALLAVILMLLGLPLARLAPAAAAALPNSYLAVSGNQIVDLSGHPVRLACAGYFTQGNIATDIAGMAAAGFNCLRFPWYDATLTANLATADQIVAAAAKVGIKVILDHHGNETPGPNNNWLPYPCNGLPFDSGPGTNGTDGCGDTGTITEAQYVADWVTVAKHYAGNSTVIGFDLTNEPHIDPWYWSKNPGGAGWATGGPDDLRAIYEQAGNAIQAVDPGALIIAEGIINWTGTLSSGAANTVTGEPDLSLAGIDPVVLNLSGRVLYSIHDYPDPISGVAPDNGALAIGAMNTGWGFLETQNIAPVWIGEMGASLDGLGPDSVGSANLEDEQAWATDLVAYLNGLDGALGGPSFSGSQKGISTDWWAWGNLTGETPDGTLDSSGTLRTQQSAVYKQLQQ